ncbi:Restriction endonuclease [Vibrio crassostreae]|nr:Restriction endonuclease [Vibrio crassostreae]CAK2947717.1 Restriction endonuclease [Vibrio crassostreae]CAK2948833.1 Restriction endonuclease [Vibrio crassostreae]CAK2949066.1 Restriction endonuclease [Vibrio crassostreae]CAK2951023.1 Restriction endonuclease [Vibrio crassostreae]
MVNVRDDIIKWLHAQPYWVQLAAQSILKQEQITQDKIVNFKELLKTEKGQSCNDALDFGQFNEYANTTNQVWIKSIGDVVGIDDLNPRLPLTFDKKLTVVYGNNGSGKSGYTRILKKACGKNNAKDLKPNVFKAPPAESKCVITIDGGCAKKFDWVANSLPIQEISSTDIFDSSTGGIYLDNENEVSYVPIEVLLFEKLVFVSTSIKSLLDAEQAQLVKTLPNTPVELTQSKYIRAINDRLKADVAEVTLREFFNFTSDDENKLNELNERLKGDPSKLRDKKSRELKQLNELITSISNASVQVSPQVCDKIYESKAKLESAKRIAEQGAKALSDENLLNGIGSQTWKALWVAAKEYSTKEAYPYQPAPYAENDAQCVLCHQPLSEAAKRRFKSFEEHIQGSLEKEVKATQLNFDNLIRKLPTIPSKDALKTQIAASNLVEEEWLSDLSKIWGEIEKTSETIAKNPDIPNQGFIFDTSQLAPLSEKAKLLGKEIENHQKDVIAFNREKLSNELNDYTAKQWASGYIDAIIQEVKRLDKYRRYEEWSKLLGTTKFTRKAGEVSKQVITDAYVQRFNNELDNLGAKKINVKLSKTRVSKGKVMHKLHLMGVNQSFVRSKSHDILSEGEQRIVSLAAFLADTNSKPQTTPFIFDDPISSLDQSYELCVAKRLGDLSEDRQVIVFTHRISLLGALNDLGNPTCIHIKREHWGCGEHGLVPLFAKKPLKALNELKNQRLAQARKLLDSHGSEYYAPLAKSICSDFRILLERVVEVEFLADVVQRHRRDVQTKNKIGNLAKITTEDCNLIEHLMGAYSTHEHSQPTESPVEPPTPEQLETDINSVIDWHTEFKSRKI